MDEIGRLGRDNWGWQARIGMFIVGNEAVPEAEMWAMAPPHVSIHAARVTASSPWAPWDTGRTTVSLADDLTRGCRQFAAMRLSAVVVGHSSSSFVGGVGWDRAVVAQLAEILGPEIALSTNGLDCQAGAPGSNERLRRLSPGNGPAEPGVTDSPDQGRGSCPANPVAATEPDPDS